MRGQLAFGWDWICGFDVGFDIIWDLPGVQINLGVIAIFIMWGLTDGDGE